MAHNTTTRRGLPWRPLYVLGLVLALGLVAASCGEDGGEGDDGGSASGGDCVSNEQFFLKEVWTPVLEKKCYVCHNPQGAARDSKMVYQPPGQAGFLEANMAIFEEAAAYSKGGGSLVLLKPTGDLEHGGAQIFAKDSDDYKSLNTMIRRLGEPDTCRASTDVASFFDGVELLTPKETLRKSSLSLVGRLPTADELATIEAGGEQALDPVLDRMMQEDAFYERLEEIFNDLFLTNKYLGRDNAVDLLNRDFYPDARWYNDDGAGNGEDPEFFSGAQSYSNNSVAREPLKLVSYIVRNNLPFTEVLTADYTVVNPYSARVYGISDIAWDDPTDPNEYKPGRIPGIPHAGVLSSPMFLNRFPTTDTNRNRHRSRVVYQMFMATDVLKLAERPIDPTSVVHNPTMNDPQCSVCHAVVDPIAGSFQNWDEQGNYDPPEAWFGDMRQPGFGKEAIVGDLRLESLSWLSGRITDDSRFDMAIVYIMYRALVGRDPLDLPRTEDSADYDTELQAYNIQRDMFQRIAAEFRANGHNLKLVVRELIKSPYYRAANYLNVDELDDKRKLAIAGLGAERLLTPEMLNRRIKAITGLPWRPRVDDQDYLLDSDEYLILYGGIDSDDVIERITEPNGIMANIQQRMANELACLHTARDFGAAPDQRVFFPETELSYVPLDENGFAITQANAAIRANIQHLYRHILGEEVALGSPELERVYDLFFEVWKEGSDKVAADELSDRLPNNCSYRSDYLTGRGVPDEERIERDPDYVVRAWMAVLTYFFSDYRFLYE